MIKGKTRIITVGGSKYFLVPESLFNDSNFPFQEVGELEIEIKEKEVVINGNRKKY